jgi:hypothetical protein
MSVLDYLDVTNYAHVAEAMRVEINKGKYKLAAEFESLQRKKDAKNYYSNEKTRDIKHHMSRFCKKVMPGLDWSEKFKSDCYQLALKQTILTKLCGWGKKSIFEGSVFVGKHLDEVHMRFAERFPYCMLEITETERNRTQSERTPTEEDLQRIDELRLRQVDDHQELFLRDEAGVEQVRDEAWIRLYGPSGAKPDKAYDDIFRSKRVDYSEIERIVQSLGETRGDRDKQRLLRPATVRAFVNAQKELNNCVGPGKSSVLELLRMSSRSDLYDSMRAEMVHSEDGIALHDVTEYEGRKLVSAALSTSGTVDIKLRLCLGLLGVKHLEFKLSRELRSISLEYARYQIVLQKKYGFGKRNIINQFLKGRHLFDEMILCLQNISPFVALEAQIMVNSGTLATAGITEREMDWLESLPERFMRDEHTKLFLVKAIDIDLTRSAEWNQLYHPVTGSKKEQCFQDLFEDRYKNVEWPDVNDFTRSVEECVESNDHETVEESSDDDSDGEYVPDEDNIASLSYFNWKSE